MQNLQKNTPLANNHISVDCVVIGFDGEQLKVLLVKRAGEDNGEVYAVHRHDHREAAGAVPSAG